jgi:hypothetical protein
LWLIVGMKVVRTVYNGVDKMEKRGWIQTDYTNTNYNCTPSH